MTVSPQTADMHVAPVLIAILMAVASGAQKPCCGPSQFMGGNGATMGIANALSGPYGMVFYQYGAWDFANRKLGYNMSIDYLNGTTAFFRLIQNFAQGEQWVILDSYEICVKQPISVAEPSNCIPDDATYLGSGWIGGVKGNGTLQDSWSTQLHQQNPSGRVDGLLSINVARENCVPISSSFIGGAIENNVPLGLTYGSGFVNVTEGIPNPDQWFTLPSFCTEKNHVLKHVHRAMPRIPKNIPFVF